MAVVVVFALGLILFWLFEEADGANPVGTGPGAQENTGSVGTGDEGSLPTSVDPLAPTEASPVEPEPAAPRNRDANGNPVQNGTATE